MFTKVENINEDERKKEQSRFVNFKSNNERLKHTFYRIISLVRHNIVISISAVFSSASCGFIVLHKISRTTNNAMFRLVEDSEINLD